MVRALRYLLIIFLVANGQYLAQSIEYIDYGKQSITNIDSNGVNWCAFDDEGNYSYINYINSTPCFITNTDTIKMVDFPREKGMKWGSVFYGQSTDLKYLIVRNTKANKIYQYKGNELASCITGKFSNHLACITLSDDSVYRYIENRLIEQKPKAYKDFVYTLDDDWCRFSDSGNYIYTIEKSTNCIDIYVNDSLVHQCLYKVHHKSINDKGDFIFSEGRLQSSNDTLHNFTFYLHHNESVYGPVRTCHRESLNNNGSFYFWGHNLEKQYLVVNNEFYREIDRVDNVNLSCDHYFFTYVKDSVHYQNFDGKIIEIPHDHLFGLTLDKYGNYSYFIEMPQHYAKVTNGKIKPLTPFAPLENLHPLDITADGNSVHYYENEDSLYLYFNNTLIKSGDFAISTSNKKLFFPSIDPKISGGVELFFFDREDAHLYFKENLVHILKTHKTLQAENNRFISNYIRGSDIAQSKNNLILVVHTESGYDLYTKNSKTPLTLSGVFNGSIHISEKGGYFYAVKDESLIKVNITFK